MPEEQTLRPHKVEAKPESRKSERQHVGFKGLRVLGFRVWGLRRAAVFGERQMLGPLKERLWLLEADGFGVWLTAFQFGAAMFRIYGSAWSP